MIISHKYRFIFFKTNKTAGTSIEIALSKFCGPEDVITPIAHEDERKRRALGYRGAQNFMIPLGQYSLQDWRHLLRTRRRLRFYNHISASEVQKHVNPRIWSEYYKFCVERNPWDRVVSQYYWHYQQEPRPSIADFVDSGLSSLRARGYEIYTIDGNLAMDRVCLYERLDIELEEVAERLKLPERLCLPRAKGGARSDRRHYREILSLEDSEKIATIFSREIAVFGYQY